MVGESRGLREVHVTIDKIAATNAVVLIEGESGTGKELVARAIHLKSRRAHGPLVTLNCAAFPEALFESELFGHERGAFTGAYARRPGKLEEASGGTLFLDEVGDLSPASQAKLLRVLEQARFSPLGSNREIRADLRIIAASNRDLAAMVRAGAFREDLLFRLNVVAIRLPPLRERKEDIIVLAHHFLFAFAKRYNRKATLPEDLQIALSEYPWPGNIRELKHAMEKYVLLGEAALAGIIHPPAPAGAPADPPPTGPAAARGGALRESLEEAEREIILQALRDAGGNKTEAARALGVSYKTLFNKINRHRIKIRSEIE
jgi:transcriptional regulator with GAF, ATPase, and Fis domain